MTAIEEAERAGFDMSLIDVSLSYSYNKRAEQHQAALELALELERIGKQLRDSAQPTRLRDVFRDLHPRHRLTSQKLSFIENPDTGVAVRN